VLPVDSEHAAVFQCLAGRRRDQVARIILTASGGPFRTWPAERIARASLEEVLNHPTWRMGRKVTIDSATLMNKALEVIEAHWLFDLPGERIEVLIHPESLVHACVEFGDGSMLAHLHAPSMRTPIALALRHGRPGGAPEAARLDLAAAGALRFEPVDAGRFPAVGLAYDVIERGGTAGAVLAAADETAVEAFVEGRIGFGRIVEIVEEVVNRVDVCSEVTLESIAEADAEARRLAGALIARSGRRPAVADG